MRLLMPMRPTLLRSPWPAMPVISVARMSGATMVLIRRRKTSLRTRRLTATAGASKPNSAPATIATNIHTVRDRRRHASNVSNAIAAQRRPVAMPCREGSWTIPNAIPTANNTIAKSNLMGSRFVLSIRCEGYQSSTYSTAHQSVPSTDSIVNMACPLTFRLCFCVLISCPLVAQTSPGTNVTAPGYDALAQASSAISSPLTQPTLTPGALLLLELEGRFAKAVEVGGGKAFGAWFADAGGTLKNEN